MLVVVLLAALALGQLGFTWETITSGLANVGQLRDDAFPPRLSVIPAALPLLLETLAVAVLGTVFGFAMALPFGVFGNRVLFPAVVAVPLRLIAAGIRAVPSLVWAVLCVAVVGFGPLAGVLATSVYAAGHLAKLQYESLEGVASEPIEAARAAGASRVAVARLVVLPEGSNALFGHLLYMFEYNVRASAIVGFVGAGGIGLAIQRHLQVLQYDAVLALVGLLFVTIVVIDAVSLQIRSRYLVMEP